MRPLSIAVLLAAPVAADAACDTPTQNTAIVASLEAALDHFGEFELEPFQEGVAAASAAVDCLDEPISRSTAAELHRARGLALFVQRDAPGARKSFAAARALEPKYTFPSTLVPAGNPVLEAYTALDPKGGAVETIQMPKSGAIKLDGSSTLNRARDLPVVFQLFDGAGGVLTTALVEGGASLPAYESRGAEAPSRPKTKDKKGGPNVPLLVASGVGLVAAGGLYGGALATKGSLGQVSAVSDLERTQSVNHALVIGSGVAGAAAIGLGTTSFLLSGRF